MRAKKAGIKRRLKSLLFPGLGGAPVMKCLNDEEICLPPKEVLTRIYRVSIYGIIL